MPAPFRRGRHLCKVSFATRMSPQMTDYMLQLLKLQKRLLCKQSFYVSRYLKYGTYTFFPIFTNKDAGRMLNVTGVSPTTSPSSCMRDAGSLYTVISLALK